MPEESKLAAIRSAAVPAESGLVFLFLFFLFCFFVRRQAAQLRSADFDVDVDRTPALTLRALPVQSSSGVYVVVWGTRSWDSQGVNLLHSHTAFAPSVVDWRARWLFMV